METDLAKKMVALADKLELAPNHDLRVQAQVLDETTRGYFAMPQTVSVPRFVGIWAKARRIYCIYANEPLV